jgi:hypothetical protein
VIYRVLVDGRSIYESDGDVIIIEPHVSTELNSAGSFEFKMPPIHRDYSIPKVLTSDVEVYEDDNLIFFGRPIDIDINFKNEKHVYCEGGLAYFNDSKQRPAEWDSISLCTFFTTLIDNHNAQVPENRQFSVGQVTMDEKEVYRKLDYESTFDCLQDMCINAEGGYLFTRKVDGVQYIDWLKDVPYVGDQPVQYGLNVMDLSQKISGSEICTAVVPRCEDSLGNKIDVRSVNLGEDFIDSDAVEVYGRITAVVDFDDISTPEELLEAGRRWLASQQFSNLTIECTAADLHYLDGNYTEFLVGQKVHVTSHPHLLDAVLPIVKLDLDLDKAGKQVTIGTVPRRELTAIVKDGDGSGKGEGNANLVFDATPTSGSNRAVTSAGIF